MTEQRLRSQLSSLLPDWDASVVDGVVGAIAGAKSRAEVDGIVKDFIETSNVDARKAIEAYATTKFPAQPAAAVAPPQEQQQPGPSDADLNAALYMGDNVKITVKRNKQKQQQQPDGRASQADRPVVNCLACGKVYDCRQPGRDALAFLASGGVCTFCGLQVRLRRDARPEGELDAAAAAAVALRDRLVQFDRHSAKRTTVLDDQSDYFAIDSNAWLSDEERAELKARQAAEEAAAEAARRRLTVTVDLLGRRVLMEEEGVGGGGWASGSGGAALEEMAAGGRERGEAEAMVEAMAATASERPQGGGAALAAAAQQEQSRIRVCPSMAAAHYTFLERPKSADAKGRKRQDGKGKGKGQAKVVEAGEGGGKKAAAGAASGAARPPRLQHDDPFKQVAAELVEIMAEGSS